MKKLALIGAGDHANEVLMQMSINDGYTFFISDEYFMDELKEFSYIKPLSEFDPKEFEVMVAVGNSRDRSKLVSKLPMNTSYFSFIHPSAICSHTSSIDQGSFIGAFSFVSIYIRLGKHALLNRAVHIGHTCFIGDYFSAMPGVIVSGNVIIGDRVYVGTNACIREKLHICNDVTIGMGSVVVKDILEPGTYVGNPARRIK